MVVVLVFKQPLGGFHHFQPKKLVPASCCGTKKAQQVSESESKISKGETQ